MDNFYQNHRRYVKSRDNDQLAGKYKDVASLGKCEPIIKNGQLWTNQRYSYGSLASILSMWTVSNPNDPDVNKRTLSAPNLESEGPAIPCGLIAMSLFNDTFELHYCKEKDCATPENITISTENIAWDSDVTYKFKNIPDDDFKDKVNKNKTYLPYAQPGGWKANQWWDMTDERFIVWMRTAGLPNFRKLYGRVENLKAGYYYLKINNQFNVKPYDGKKSFVLSTANILGGKNYFLAFCYIGLGALCMIFAFIFCFAYMKRRGQNPE